MKYSKFEVLVLCGILLGWVQLMCGFTAHAFYSLGILIVIILMEIKEYTKIK